MNPPPKCRIPTCYRVLGEKNMAKASVVCDGESFETRPKGDNYLGTVIFATIIIGCRIIFAPVMRNETLVRRGKNQFNAEDGQKSRKLAP